METRQIVLPHTLLPPCELEGKKIIFTAGPIPGGEDWQYRCIELLYQKAPGPLIVACPCRYKLGHPLFEHRAIGENDGIPSQVPWERHWLTLASKLGSILFWAPVESKINPRTLGEYATGTKREFYEWFYRTLDDPFVNIVLGAEADFPNIEEIALLFGGLLCNPPITLLHSLEAVVDAALERAFSL